MRQQILNTYAMTLDTAKKLVADVEDPDFAKPAFDEAKHPAWTLSHLAIASGMAAAFLDPRAGDGPMGGVPDAWAKVSAPGVSITNERDAYATKPELLGELERVHALASDRFANASDAHFASPFPNPDYRAFWPTVGDGAFYMLAYHEGWHLGQLSQWRRATGYPPIG